MKKVPQPVVPAKPKVDLDNVAPQKDANKEDC